MEENQNQNQSTQTQNEQAPAKKGIIEQFKGLGITGYLCICVIAKAIVEIVKAISKK